MAATPALALLQFMCLLSVHYVADWVLQTRWQAENKSKDNRALSQHVAVYTICLMVACPFIFGFRISTLVFVVINGLAHFGTDYVTSRMAATLYQAKSPAFWYMIGLDQLIHQATFIITIIMFLQ